MIALTTAQIIAIVIFVVVMALIISEKVHRTTAALAGAVALILSGVLTFDNGVEHIDFGTLGVLVGMMIFVAVVKNSGIFEYLAIRAAKLAKGNPWIIMVLFCLITAVLSAFLDNVTTVLLIGPVTFTVCKMLELSPVLPDGNHFFERWRHRNAHRRPAEHHDRLRHGPHVLRLPGNQRPCRAHHPACFAADVLRYVRQEDGRIRRKAGFGHAAARP